MPEAVAYAIELAATYLETEMVYTAGEIYMASQAIVAVAAVYTMREQQRRAEAASKDAYNASLKDRYLMLRGATEQRQMVLGRQRVSGPIGFISSYGAQHQHLVFTVTLAAHEIDAVEAIYFNDEPLILDSSGNVTGIRRTDTFSIAAATASVTLSSLPQAGTVTATAVYGTTSVALTVVSVTLGTADAVVSVSGAHAAETGTLVLHYQPNPCPFAPVDLVSHSESFTAGGSGTDVFTINASPALNVFAVTVGADNPSDVSPLTSSTSGTSVTVTGAPGGRAVVITYQTSSQPSLARVRVHLGAPGQVADATMVANLGGVWTSAHRGDEQAHLVVELDFDTTAFSGGIPNVSAVVRGLKCFDPRTTTTAWTQNPALLMRGYATHALGGRQAASAVHDASLSTAATVCDVSAAYTVGGATYTRPTYTGGLVAKTGTRPSDVLNDLAQAMGGRWCMVDGAMHVKAGSYTAPVLPLTESWLHDAGTVQVQPRRNRHDVLNAVTGTFADQDEDYKILQFPKVTAATYVTEDGAELPTNLQMAAVTWSGQAQYIAACQIRYGRQGMIVKLTCNMRAYQAEPFDVISVTLPRFGWVAAPFEVLDVSWPFDGGIELTLKSIDPSIWAMDAGYPAAAMTPNTRLPSPWDVPTIAGLSAISNASTNQKQPDGSVSARVLVSWTLVADQRITQGGSVELKWGLATDPEAKWATLLCAGNATSAYLAPVHTGGAYIVKARTTNSAATSPWCAQVLCQASTTTVFAGFVPWSGVSAKPANLAAITGAENLSLNLVSAANWVIGSSGDQTTGGGTQWTALKNTDGCTNQINIANGPDGSLRPIWYAISGTATTGNPEGGIGGTSAIAIDNTKLYRFACWIYVTGPSDGSIYLGIGGNQVDDIPSGNINTNPYFHALGRSVLTVNRWYLFTGQVLPAGYSAAQTNMSGVYDGTTGQKVQNGVDYRWHAGITACTLRTFQFYTGGAGRYALFTSPRFDQLDGSEPSIAALIADAVLSRANTAYTNANAAQGDATAALASLTNIASDSILSPSEKPSVVQDYTVITGEQAGIVAQATAYGVSHTAYDSAVTALTSYLAGITGWNTVPGSDVTIVGATFRSNFANVYTAKQALLNAVAAAAGLVATWAGIPAGTGKAADNATVNTVTYSATAPSSPGNGDIWIDTSVTPNVTRARVAGAWQIGANYSTNTNQLTDGANLGGTATWAGIPTGTGKAADNATLGATWGTNLTGQPADAALLNSLQTWAQVTGAGRPADNATQVLPVSVTASSTFSTNATNNSGATILTAPAIDVGAGSTALIACFDWIEGFDSGGEGGGGGLYPPTFYIFRNSTQIDSYAVPLSASSGSRGCSAYTIKDTPGAGSTVYSVRATGSTASGSTPQILRRSLTVIGIKP